MNKWCLPLPPLSPGVTNFWTKRQWILDSVFSDPKKLLLCISLIFYAKGFVWPKFILVNIRRNQNKTRGTKYGVIVYYLLRPVTRASRSHLKASCPLLEASPRKFYGRDTVTTSETLKKYLWRSSDHPKLDPKSLFSFQVKAISPLLFIFVYS